MGLDEFGFLDILPDEEGSDIDRDAQVRGDEGLVVEGAILGAVDEDVEAAGKGDEDAEEHGDVRSDDSQRGFVRDG